MKITFLLHFYQPHNQETDILERIVQESYLPLTRGLLKNPKAKIVVNISGTLTELLVSNRAHVEVINNIKQLAQNGQVEFTESAKYHAFLPLLPEVEIKRQIEINNKINKQVFGEFYDPTGFFSPEMAINKKVINIAKELGYKWISASELAHETGSPKRDVLYKDKDSGMVVFFRHKRSSSLILTAQCRTAEDFIKETQDLHDELYWFCAMDAETFGHHRIGHEKLLFDILENSFFEPVLARDLLNEIKDVEETSVRPSTWTNQEQDFWLDKERTQMTEAKSFILWQDPDNPIHKRQWELTNFVIDTLKDYPNKQEEKYISAREKLDKAVASDQYWWASAKPWWSLELVVLGAFSLKDVIKTLSPGTEYLDKAEEMYRAVLDQAFDWQRTGYIRKMHLDTSETFMKKAFKERTPSEWFNQVVLEFEKEMNDSAAKQDFEKAIKWRDAVLKVKMGTDKHDVLHVVNELWSARSNIPWAKPQVKPFLDHEWEEFSEFAKNHFIEVTSKEDFEAWKLKKKTETEN
ncbi:UvrB/UvrC motif-containing protein [Patescibacteria group bacterium]